MRRMAKRTKGASVTRRSMRERNLESFARLLTDDYALTLKCAGEKTFTEDVTDEHRPHKAITIGWPPKMVKPEEVLVTQRAMTGHESYHCLFTNFAAMEGMSKLEKYLFNIIEDGRIEALGFAMYEGTEKWLTVTTRRLLDRAPKPATESDEALRALMEYAIAHSAYKPESGDVKRFMAEAKPIVDRALRSPHSPFSDAKELTKLFLKFWPSPPGGEGGKGKGKGSGEEWEEALGGAEGEIVVVMCDMEHSGGGPKLSPAEQAKLMELVKKGKVLSPEEAKELFEKLEKEVTKAARRSLKAEKKAEAKEVKEATEAAAKKKKDEKLDVERVYFPTTEGTLGPFYAELTEAKENALEAKRLTQKVRAQVTALKAKLRTLVFDKVKSSWQPSRRGRINAPALWRTAFHDDKVFEKKHDGNPLDVAVSILVDWSGSMSGNKIECAMEACVIIAEAFEHFGVSLEVAQFGVTHERGSTYFNHRFLKRFGENYRDVRDRFWQQECLSDNNDGASLDFAMRRLLGQRERQKLFVQISDGIPATGGVDATAVLKAAVRKYRNLNLLAVGIMTEHVKEYYPYHIIVHKPEELPGKFASLAKQVIRAH